VVWLLRRCHRSRRFVCFDLDLPFFRKNLTGWRTMSITFVPTGSAICNGLLSRRSKTRLTPVKYKKCR
ncbi:hypothetical protein GIB67_003929, partial [Kingdonia uniflora]